MQSIDGNQAAAQVGYALSDIAFIFPITPSSPMGEHVDAWASIGRKNIFGQVVSVTEMQSEGGAAGAVHGAATTGSLVTTYTASQGLLLMIPNMFKIAGELLPVVFHVTARSIAGQALCIFGDHSDVMACRSTGFCMLSSHTVQECADLALVAHVAALKSSLPFMHFFDGFRTSHEIQKVKALDEEKLKSMVPMDKVYEFRNRGLNPKHPILRGTSQGPDVYFQNVEAGNKFYDAVPEIVLDTMKEFAEKFGRSYKLYDYYGAADADRVVVLMGAGAPICEEAADFLMAKGEKVGIVKVHLYRPFAAKYFLEAIPATAKVITVLDRTKEPGALGEPLYLDVVSAFNETDRELPTFLAGRYGLGSKDFTPAMAKAVFDNMKEGKQKNHFTVGINDDVTHTSLEVGEEFDSVPEGTTQCMFWGLGSDGTVGANHDAIRIIGDNTDMFVQGYFSYDAHKSGGVTVSHLRFGKKPIKSQYLIQHADYIACHFPNYIYKYKLIENLREGGIFVLNCTWSAAEMDKVLPGSLKREIAAKKAEFYIINAGKIANAVGLGRRINMVMQASFFKLANVIPYEQAKELLKKAIAKTYGSKGQKIVDMNIAAVEQAVDNLVKVEVPAAWADAPLEAEVKKEAPKFVTDLLWPQLAMKGNSLPVSAFEPGGVNPMGTTKYEKRGIAVNIPIWDGSKCMQCNECSVVCPHAAIRPFLLDAEDAGKAPETFATIAATTPACAKAKLDGYKFRIQVSAMDCTGCEVCTTACNYGAIAMQPALAHQEVEAKNWEFATTVKNHGALFDRKTLIGSQFQQPLLEFSGACEGCSETAYMKLATQLYGERMVLAQATGCSSIWGGTWGTIPYTVNEKGHGPAWANSLFEDDAEFGLGMAKANEAARRRLKDAAEAAIADKEVDAELVELLKRWVANFNDAQVCEEVYDAVLPLVEKVKGKHADLYTLRNYFPKLSQWIQGGDGWAYDIGYGGLDHVIASGVDLNVFVLDTEMYSNTGGQRSKATPMGAVAKFAAGGNRCDKKDLGLMAMAYKNIYVASICIQADPEQAIKAIAEAEAYPGCSLILCYSPCREQGFNIANAIEEARLAVKTGYWNLYRYNPALAKEGKNPLTLDSDEISSDLKAFLARENRYALLMRTKKDVATELQSKLEVTVKQRMENLKRLAANVSGAAAAAAAPQRKKGDKNKRVPVQRLAAADRVKSFDEVDAVYSKEDATEEAERCLGCKKPKCQDTCPAHVPVPQYIAAIKAGKYAEGAEQVYTAHPFLNVCGRVCTHPCESKCVRGIKGEPLAIMHLKRTLAAYGKGKVECAADCGKRVAVVGSGPAGLEAAFVLAKRGVKVTIYEAAAQAGGLLNVIPAFKLPQKAREEDIQTVLSLPNVELKLNAKVEDVAALKKDYDAVVVATGAVAAASALAQAEDVHAFLKSVKEGRKDIGKNVVVHGKGLPAFDTARVAARLGANVVMACADPAGEVAEAEAEGVRIVKAYVKAFDGKTATLENGESVPADVVVAACACLNKADDKLPKAEGVFCVGDAVTGMTSVIEAVGHALKATEEVVKFLGL